MIRIITLYNSYNVGAFLQAFSLYSLLKKKNWDVSFLDVGQNPEQHQYQSRQTGEKGLLLPSAVLQDLTDN